MQNLNARAIVFGITGLVVVVVTLMVLGVIPGLKESNKAPEVAGSVLLWTVGPETLEYDRAWKELIASFNGKYPAVKVTRENFTTLSEYERALAASFGSKETPDVFMVENVAMPRYENKLVPAPASVFTLDRLRVLFPKIVETDFAREGKIYGLPLSIDTLALVYNREMLDQAAVAVPKSWEAFASTVPALTVSDVNGISIAGAALGGSDTNIPTAVDILQLMMIQNGTKMVDDGLSRAVFSTPEGDSALQFYSSFSDRTSEHYTWNESMPNARDFFAEEKVGMLIDYRSSVKALETKNRFLDIGVSEVPAPESLVSQNRGTSFARYLSFVVSGQSKNPSVAWVFVSSITADEGLAKKFTTAVGEPPALRSLALAGKNDPELGVFSRQTLTASTWYQADNDLIRGIFSNAIRAVNNNQKTPTRALDEAAGEVSKIMQRGF